MVYSPLDAVKLAQKNPDREVVFFAVGFETTAPVNGMAVHQARKLAYRILVSYARTCWCRLLWRRFWAPRTTWCRASWLPGTYVR